MSKERLENDIDDEPWMRPYDRPTMTRRARLYWRLRRIGVSRREAFRTARHIKGVRL